MKKYFQNNLQFCSINSAVDANDPIWKTQYAMCSNIARKGDINQETVEASNESISLYPNPANHTLNIRSNSGAVVENIRMMDIQGKEVAYFGSVEIIDVSAFPNGLYYVELSVGGSTERKKMQIIK